jgi:hypothetical protein
MLCQLVHTYRRFGRAPMRLSYGLTRSLDGQTLKKEAVSSSETWVWVLTPVLMLIQVFWDVFILKMAALSSPRNVRVKEIIKRPSSERASKLQPAYLSSAVTSRLRRVIKRSPVFTNQHRVMFVESSPSPVEYPSTRSGDNLHILGRWRGTSKHNCLVSYVLFWRRHVSATVGHLQVTKMYVEENYTEYDHSIGACSKLSTRSHCWADYTHWAKSTSSRVQWYLG